jgi:hypothetical protein
MLLLFLFTFGAFSKIQPKSLASRETRNQENPISKRSKLSIFSQISQQLNTEQIPVYCVLELDLSNGEG